MKLKVTNKKLKECFKYIIYVDDLKLIDYVYNEGASWYNCGVYGWNYDVFNYNYNTCLVKGYRNLPYNLRDYKTIEKYNNIFNEAIKDLKFGDYEKKQEIAIKLLDEFIKEMTKND